MSIIERDLHQKILINDRHIKDEKRKSGESHVFLFTYLHSFVYERVS